MKYIHFLVYWFTYFMSSSKYFTMFTCSCYLWPMYKYDLLMVITILRVYCDERTCFHTTEWVKLFFPLQCCMQKVICCFQGVTQSMLILSLELRELPHTSVETVKHHGTISMNSIFPGVWAQLRWNLTRTSFKKQFKTLVW